VFLDEIPKGLEPEEFDKVIGELYGRAVNNNANFYVLKANTKLKSGDQIAPVGFVVLSNFQEVLYPHVFWMPWATPRNKMETSVRFLADLNKEHNVMVIVPKETFGWFSHLGKYGVLRKVGTLLNHKGEGQNATLFEGVRQWVV
jgi:hypothetical protein